MLLNGKSYAEIKFKVCNNTINTKVFKSHDWFKGTAI